MTDKSSLLSDLDFAAQLAKDGAQTPLLGGPFQLMWSSLLIPTLILHGLILSERLPLTIDKAGLLWLSYGLIGTFLSVRLGKRTGKKLGSNSLLNRVGANLGISTGVLISAFAITTVIGVGMGKLDSTAYNSIIPVAFGLSALNHAVLGGLTRKTYIRASAVIAGAMMVITLLLTRETAIYFVAALGVFLTMTLPGYLEMRGESKNG